MNLSKLVFVLTFLAAPAPAQEYQAGGLAIERPWSRPTPPGAAVAGGFLTITNGGSEADRLLSVSSPIAQSVEVYESSVVDGVAKMRPLGELEIAAGATIELKPGGAHLMFVDPTVQLKQGDRFPATLIFDKAGPVNVEFVVQRTGGNPNPMHPPHAMD